MDYVCVAKPGAAQDDTLAEQLVDLASRAVKKVRG